MLLTSLTGAESVVACNEALISFAARTLDVDMVTGGVKCMRFGGDGNWTETISKVRIGVARMQVSVMFKLQQ